jgi:hypothetical protein
MSNRGWLSRYWVAGAFALAVAASGPAAVAAWGAPAGGPARPGASVAVKTHLEFRECKTDIKGVTENRTRAYLEFTELGYGQSYHPILWRHRPHDVFQGTTFPWELCTDSHEDAAMHIGYQILQNGDRVRFFADIRRGGETTAGCSFRETVPTAREYECEAEISHSGTGSGVAVVKFILRTHAR